ncbi:DUF3995 domain-containing protein [Fictibacillus sp. WQ 8-8]|uniref:DUF3995 domain-containing protein n=1 Tax=Fictibacillus sp. WQ 8-8 TaxID=2938788 RepID=UPI00210A61A2|nr:DUF3995 domain-containing protein [Fictibacillus sp. WQ 8-8]MCQ6268609.1 DUF3995 domain-containing protein [Fictibacillus sp. WQ 8-8]
MSKINLKVWPGYAGCLWAIMYAVFVRFYQAAGGSIGLPGRLANPEGFQMVSYIAGVVVMLAGFFLLGLVKPWGKTVPAWIPWIGGKNVHPLLLLIPTLIGCAFAIAHGVSGIITKILHLVGIITIQIPGWIELDVRELALWDILVYEPWFIVMGILAGLAAWNYANDTKILHPILRQSAILYVCLIILLTALFVSAIIFDFLKF